ncbi:MAG TPA: hypothetical protein VJ698_17225 [Noviherbaspirillum sp.]|uniref:hypothetical protein n=1 Tax=Noviherbaspirillum sp. TaxID=1926288 RepID=UPI002B47F9AE|nr:hypothetical protein [Noviherbaspirillum sp.]HJV87211.1 hypothetical protein [Noviherbaspirillum sp.]
MFRESRGAILQAGLVAVLASAAALALTSCGSDDARMATAAGRFLLAPSTQALNASAAFDDDPVGPTESLPAVSRHFAIYRLSRPVFDASGNTSGPSGGSDAPMEKFASSDRDGIVDTIAACSMRAMLMQE